MSKSDRHQIIAIVVLGIFTILAILVKIQFAPLLSLDESWLERFQTSAIGQHTLIWHTVTTLGSPVITGCAMVIVSLFLMRTHQWSWAAFILATLVGGDALLLVVKHLVGRLRPIHQVIQDTGFGFPSGHVFSAALLACILITLIVRSLDLNWLSWGLIAVFSVAVIGLMLARLGLRNHYPSDVMGGVLLASGWWLQLLSLVERLPQYFENESEANNRAVKKG
ncbi:phosphatase PAP2 family protein [Levilactobacillus tangyuanensis]|uniref:Phosphatase PAP2 family protein n=1 Tax=Levilactobacillus tangyuanensis TaxID=2486021 RepID=A0ABW1TNI1_9LACO|nr:phosphatase PAP2 family protein [Levilactobacillus tangyuanensis]